MRNKQYFKILIYDRLIYLCGSAHPIIPYKGIKHDLAATVCWCAHYFVKICHISAGKLYKKFEEECIRYNHANTKEITTFGDGACLNYKMCKSNVFPIKYVPFENTMIPVMKANAEHLEKTYGDYMTIPSKENQINHAPYEIDFGDFES